VEFVWEEWEAGGTKGRRHEVRGEAKGVRWLVDGCPAPFQQFLLPESDQA